MILGVSVAQLVLTDGDPAANLSAAREAASQAARRGSDLLVLPELWLSGYALAESERLALAATDARWEALADLAARNAIAIAGSVLVRSDRGFRNRLVVHARDGRVVATYDKIHPCRLLDEDRYLEPGDQVVVADLGFPAGLAICYDLRFPELFRRLATLGARIILLPAQWPQIRREHWLTLVKARAIENQVYIVACNRTGGTLPFAGHSLVVDPWGDVLQAAGESPTLLTAEIDLDRVTQIREQFPVWRDLKQGVY